MPKDSKYVSAEMHEIKKVASLFQDKHNKPVNLALLYAIHAFWQKPRVLRTELYQALELMGYNKRPKE